MGKLTEIREEMAEALNVIPGVQVSAYGMAKMTPPTLVVMPGTIQFHQAMQNGHSDWGMRVRAYVSAVSDRGAQIRLDEFIGETSGTVLDALEDHSTTVWDDLTVTSLDGYQEYGHADGTVYLGCEWTVEIMAQDN